MNDAEPNPLRDKIAALPREIPPARDLWPEIRARLDAKVEPEVRAGLTRATQGALRRWRLPLAVAAALALAATLHWLRPAAPAASWAVASLAGTPRIDHTQFTGPTRLPEGGWLETDAVSQARIEVGDIGEVSIGPNSRLRLVNASTSDHRLELARGRISALIWAPPRLFFVETPSATAIDLGCAYTLTVDERGVGVLEVTSGYVALEHGDRESIIPAGLVCLTYPGLGPGTPFSTAATVEFRAALNRFDAGDDTALETITAAARDVDAVTLWHLLARAPGTARGLVFDKLALLRPVPAGVSREGIIAGDPAMRHRWARDLGLLAYVTKTKR